MVERWNETAITFHRSSERQRASVPPFHQLRRSRVRQTDRPSRATLQRSVHGARIGDEVEPRPRISGEVFGRQHVSFLTVAPRARQHDVAGYVRPAVRQRIHVIQRREVELERSGAVHTAPAAIAHGGPLDRSFLLC